MGWFWTAAALAGSLSGWGLDEGAWFVDGAVWLEGADGAMHLDDAFVFRSLTPDGDPAGWVVVGGASATVRPRDAMGRSSLANRLPVGADARAVADGHGWAVPADRLVVFGAVDALPDGALAIDDHGGAVVFTSDDGREEVVVSDLPRLAVARRRAQEALLDEVDRWASSAMDPRIPVVLDALDPREDARWVAGVRVRPDVAVPWDGNRWMRWVRDGSGILEPGRASVVRGADLRVVADDPLPTTSDGRRAAPRRLDLRSAGVLAAFRVETGGQAAELGVAADLVVQALGGPATVAVLDIPHTEQRAWYSNPPLANAFTLEGVTTADGQPLTAFPLALTPDQREGRGAHRTVVVPLAEPLEEGDATTLRVRWKDRRRYAHVLEIDERPFLLDVSTGVVPVMPVVRGDDGAPAPVRLRAGVGSEIRRDDVVVAGRVMARTEPEKGLEWVEADTTSTRASIAAGRFHEGQVPGGDGVPDMETYVQIRADAQRLAATWAWTARLVDPIVPNWPERLPVVGGDSVVWGTPRAQAHEGMVQLHPTFVSSEQPLAVPTGTAIATALLAERWEATAPVGEAEAIAWLGAQLAGWWALQAEGSEADQRAWRQRVRTQARPKSGRRVATRHLAYHWLDVGSGALPEAFGDRAVRQAFTEILAGRYDASWAGLAEALSAASGIDATDYVALWLASGVRPSLDLQWRHDAEAGRLVARVLSDVPYGSMPVSLTVRRGGKRVQVPMSLFDGIARAEVPWNGRAPRRVALDAGAHPVATVAVRQQP